MLYTCTRIATVGVKGIFTSFSVLWFYDNAFYKSNYLLNGTLQSSQMYTYKPCPNL